MNETLFALVDCNSFYCSCERVFNPAARGKPVIVLSNNDGCAVARSDEAKAIGISMGAPYFQIRQFCKDKGVYVFSSNYALYGDMSRRVMETLSQFTPEMQVYSIDEAFLSLVGFSGKDLAQYAQEIKDKVYKETGIPVSVGIGKTKVLAKIANRLSKKNTVTPGVFVFGDDEHVKTSLMNYPVQGIWGMGGGLSTKARTVGWESAWDLVQADPGQVQKVLHINGRRIRDELKGHSCIEIHDLSDEKKQIMSTRSFGRAVVKIEELKEAVANHITSAAEKLRKQNSLSASVSVFIRTGRHAQGPKVHKSGYRILPVGTASTSKLIKEALAVVDEIYEKGYKYKKCGIYLGSLTSQAEFQADLFNSADTSHDDKRMKLMDAINSVHGKGTIRVAACGTDRFWEMLSEMRSAAFTTRWSELLDVD